jgi:hypothetical protein
MARLLVVVCLGTVVLWPPALWAQSPGETGGSPRVGDRYTYNMKDEITGEPKIGYIAVVTEVSDKEIVTSVSNPGRNASQVVVLDRDLNRIDDSTWKFKPNNAQGIRPPLAVGKTWRFEFDSRNTQSGAAFRTTGVSKVVAQETVTTPAGTFETFKIERHQSEYNTIAQSRITEVDSVIWYAPKINRWVRRTFVTRFDKRLRSSTSEELAEYHRK